MLSIKSLYAPNAFKNPLCLINILYPLKVLFKAIKELFFLWYFFPGVLFAPNSHGADIPYRSHASWLLFII
jgi:hypothetical protein